MKKRKEDMAPLTGALTTILIILFIIFTIWGTTLAFIGGTLPIVGIPMQGSLISGLLWLFIIDPILMTVGFWISAILVIPVQLYISWLTE